MDENFDPFDNEYGEENLFPNGGGFPPLALTMIDMIAMNTGCMEMSVDDYISYNNDNPPNDNVIESMTESFIGALHSIQDREIDGLEIDPVEGTNFLVKTRGEDWIEFLLKYHEDKENYEICKDLHESLLIYQSINHLVK